MATSGLHLDFLLVNRSTLYSGRVSKKSTFSGMSVSFSHRAWSRPAMSATDSFSFFTVWRI